MTGDVYTGIWWDDLRETDHFEDLGVDGRKVLRWIFRRWHGGLGWIGLAQDMERKRAVVNAVLNLRVP
jgi:hypothetical protein